MSLELKTLEEGKQEFFKQLTDQERKAIEKMLSVFRKHNLSVVGGLFDLVRDEDTRLYLKTFNRIEDYHTAIQELKRTGVFQELDFNRRGYGTDQASRHYKFKFEGVGVATDHWFNVGWTEIVEGSTLNPPRRIKIPDHYPTIDQYFAKRGALGTPLQKVDVPLPYEGYFVEGKDDWLLRYAK